SRISGHPKSLRESLRLPQRRQSYNHFQILVCETLEAEPFVPDGFILTNRIERERRNRGIFGDSYATDECVPDQLLSDALPRVSFVNSELGKIDGRNSAA